MKKSILIVMILLLGCSREEEINDPVIEEPNFEYVSGTVNKIEENRVLIVDTEECGQIWFTNDYAKEFDFGINDVIEIEYNGALAESYPCQGTMTDWNVLEEYIDIDPPEMEFIGEQHIYISVGDEYTDSGVTVNDDSDYELIIEGLDKIKTTFVKDYFIRYHATDIYGNTAKLTRVVHVTRGEDEFINDIYSIDFETVVNREPDLTEREYYKFVYIEANPSKGFNFPYVIELPKNTNIEENLGKPIYPILSVSNLDRFDGGYNGNWNELLKDQLSAIHGPDAYNMNLSKDLYLPEITIIVPQPCWGDQNMAGQSPEGGLMWLRNLNEHAVNLKEVHQSGNLIYNVNGCDVSSEDEVFVPEQLYDIDEQMYNITQDALYNLRQAGWDVEDQFFLYGYSNTAEFVQGFSTIYPEAVKAYYAGGAFESLIPKEMDKGVSLTYPYGLSDFEELFEKQFDLEKWNQIAKYHDHGLFDIHGGSADNESSYEIYNYIDEFLYDGDSSDKLTMIFNNMIKVLDENGTGMTVINIEKSHQITRNDSDRVTEFFRMNRDSETPVYYETGFNDEYIIFNLEQETVESLTEKWSLVESYIQEFTAK